MVRFRVRVKCMGTGRMPGELAPYIVPECFSAHCPKGGLDCIFCRDQTDSPSKEQSTRLSNNDQVEPLKNLVVAQLLEILRMGHPVQSRVGGFPGL